MVWKECWYRLMMVTVGAGVRLARGWVSLGVGEMGVRRTCCVLLLHEMGDLYVIV